MTLITDRLGELLNKHEILYGVICRDATLTDVELMAQVGYHVVWMDLEHSPQTVAEAVQLSRTVTHLGMVPLVRILELSRTNLQPLVDGGVQIIALPDVRSAAEAAELVRLTKYPPLGERGVSTTNPGIGFHFGTDRQETLRQANAATHPMVMFESDEGYEVLDDILDIEGIDVVTTGPMDWATSLGLSGEEAKANLDPKIERVVTETVKVGKIASMGAGTPDQVQHFRGLGVRMFFVGVDVAMKRRALVDSLEVFQKAIETSR